MLTEFLVIRKFITGYHWLKRPASPVCFQERTEKGPKGSGSIET